MTARSKSWGGPRKGAGRKPGFGKNPEGVRRNRVTLTLTDAELSKLSALASERGLPVGTLAYEYIERALRRTK